MIAIKIEKKDENSKIMFVLSFLVSNMVFLSFGKTKSLPDGGKKK